MSSPVLMEVAAGIATVTLNRPETRNALDRDTWQGLDRAVAAADADPRVHCLVLHGAGGCFSSGGDLRTMGSGHPGLFGPVDRLRAVHRALTSLERAGTPTVAAVEGFAIGAGWSVALACDLVVAARDAFFSAPFLQRGLVPDCGIAWLLRQRVGPTVAAELLLLGDRIDAGRAQQLGVVTRLTDPGEALAGAVELASRLSRLPADTLELAKRLLHGAAGTDLRRFLDAEETAVALSFTGEDAAEGRAAFLERRPPRFNRGRDDQGELG